MRYFFLLGIIVLGLNGCGYKGNLYLPKDTNKTALYFFHTDDQLNKHRV